MVRGRVELKRIENTTSRQVTFSKRRSGLLKKAYELSVLCEAEIALIIFSQNGKLYEFSSSGNMRKTLERYRKYVREGHNNNGTAEIEQHKQHLRCESENILKKTEVLEASRRFNSGVLYRKLLGQHAGSCSMEELEEIEGQLEISLRRIRARKAQLFREEIETLKAKEKFLVEENARLAEKLGVMKSWPVRNVKEKEIGTMNRPSQSTVETELFLGLPEMRCAHI